MPAKFASFNRGRPAAGKYRSALEEKVAWTLSQEHIPFEYESERFSYVVPSKTRKYTPDFVLTTPTGPIYLEVKGWWPSHERTRIKAVTQANPDIRLVMVLQRPNAAITRGSKTTLSAWCERNRIEWVPCPIPEETLKEWMSPQSKPTYPAPPARVQTELPFTATGTCSASCASGSCTKTAAPGAASPSPAGGTTCQ